MTEALREVVEVELYALKQHLEKVIAEVQNPNTTSECEMAFSCIRSGLQLIREGVEHAAGFEPVQPIRV